MTDTRKSQCFESHVLEESYELYVHSSGLRVVVCQKDVATVYAMLGVAYGSVDAPLCMPSGLPTGQQTPLGIAHFLEHKMFEKNDGTSVDLQFSELGAEVNAYTSYDKTVYYVSCTRNFEKALELLLNLVSDLTITRSSVTKERAIIAEEIRMNNDSPFERCYAELLRAMYQKHRVREEICGTEASLRKITPKLLKAHFEAYYHPQNMVLSVVGKVDVDKIFSVIDACLGEVKPFDMALLSDKPVEPDEPFKAEASIQMQVPKPLFCIGVKDNHIPKDPKLLFRKDLMMTLLTEMLFSRSGTFYSDLFESGIITPTYSYGSAIGDGYGYYALSGEGDDPALIYDRFCAYIHTLQATGLSKTDFERSRRVLYGDYVTSFDAAEDIAQSLLTYTMDGVLLFDFIPTLLSITLEEVTELFRTCFVPEKYAMSVVLPLNETPIDNQRSD